MAREIYHYTECGLDNVYLESGFEYIDEPDGRYVAFQDLDGLHRCIGVALVNHKESLTGKEIRFLRTEMLLSQVKLASLLRVNEQAVRRWENGKSALPKPAEHLIRLLYREHIHDNDHVGIRAGLERAANLDDVSAGAVIFTLKKPTRNGWTAETASAA